MDENLTSKARHRIPGDDLIWLGSNPDRNPRQNFPKFHTDSTQTARKTREAARWREKPRAQKSL
jgi:hypothetical protein